MIAEDISTDFLDKAKARGQVLGLTNAKFILGTEQDPKLPADTLEAVLVLDTYHHFDYPEAMLGHIRDSLLSNGRLVIVDFYKRPDAMPNWPRHGAYPAGRRRCDQRSGSQRIPADVEERADPEDAVYCRFCEEVSAYVIIRLRPA